MNIVLLVDRVSDSEEFFCSHAFAQNICMKPGFQPGGVATAWYKILAGGCVFPVISPDATGDCGCATDGDRLMRKSSAIKL